MRRKNKTSETDFVRRELVVPACVDDFIENERRNIRDKQGIKVNGSDIVSFLVAERSTNVKKLLKEAGYVFPE